MALLTLGLVGIAVSAVLGVLGLFDRTEPISLRGLKTIGRFKLSLLLVASAVSAAALVLSYLESLNTAKGNIELRANVLRSIDPIGDVRANIKLNFSSKSDIAAPYIARLNEIVKKVDTALAAQDEKAYRAALPVSVGAEPRVRGGVYTHQFANLRIEPGPFAPDPDRANEVELARSFNVDVRLRIFCQPIDISTPKTGMKLMKPDRQMVFRLDQKAIYTEYNPSTLVLSMQESLIPEARDGRNSTDRITSVRDLEGAQVFVELEQLYPGTQSLPLDTTKPIELTLRLGDGQYRPARLSNPRVIRWLDMKDLIVSQLHIDGVADTDNGSYLCSRK
jgi:hypothetical protein